MERKPCWTLRAAAALLMLAPVLDAMIAGTPLLRGSFRAFDASSAVGAAMSLAGWAACWILALAASIPALRANAGLSWLAASLSILLAGLVLWRAYGELNPYGQRPFVGCLPLLLFLGGLGFIGGMLFLQVELEVVAAWARILLAASLVTLGTVEVERRWSVGGLISSVGVLILAALLWGVGEVWALASAPPREPGRAED